MAVTRLERKGRKNKARAKARVKRIKSLNFAPVIKNVDVEAIKAEFAKKGAKTETKVEAAEAQADVKEEKVGEVKETKKATAKEASEEKPKAEAKKPATKKKAAPEKKEEE